MRRQLVARHALQKCRAARLTYFGGHSVSNSGAGGLLDAQPVKQQLTNLQGEPGKARQGRQAEVLDRQGRRAGRQVEMHVGGHQSAGEALPVPQPLTWAFEPRLNLLPASASTSFSSSASLSPSASDSAGE